jgi:hypothetical protein
MKPVSAIPTDPAAAIGYEALYAPWKENQQRDITTAEFRDWIERVRGHLAPNELAIFDGIFVERSFSKAQVKAVANLYKILRDRHDAHASEVEGGPVSSPRPWQHRIYLSLKLRTRRSATKRPKRERAASVSATLAPQWLPKSDREKYGRAP